MHRLAVIFLFTLLAIPVSGYAEEAPPGLRAVASRLFLAPGLSSRYDDSPDFLPLTELDWIEEVEEADPLLGPQGTVLHVRKLPSPPALLLSDEGIPGRYQSHDAVPEALRFDGLDVRTSATVPNPQIFTFRPNVPEPDFVLTCMDPDLATGVFDFCQMLATYPLDPAITLKARFYRPIPIAELAPQLPAIAARMREIALCLDVTEAPPSAPEAALAALLEVNPTLSGCENKLSS